MRIRDRVRKKFEKTSSASVRASCPRCSRRVENPKSRVKRDSPGLELRGAKGWMEALAATEHKHKTSGPSKVEGSMGRGRSPLGKTVAAVRLVVGQGSSSRTSGADCLQCPLAGAPSFFFPLLPYSESPCTLYPISSPHPMTCPLSHFRASVKQPARSCQEGLGSWLLPFAL